MIEIGDNLKTILIILIPWGATVIIVWTVYKRR